MQLIVLPHKRQTRQERHGKLVIIVIIITIIIISLGSSRYPSTGSDASYAWVETVKREEATCTECKIQKGFWGEGTLSISSSPPLLLTLSFALSAQFSFLVTKICFPCLPYPNLFPISATPSLMLVTFICFAFHRMSFLMYLQFLSHSHTILQTYTHTCTRPARHVTRHHHIATRLQHHCISLFPQAVGCISFHFWRQRNGTFRSPRNAPLPFLPHYANSEPPQRVYPRFPEADISSYLRLANTAQLKTIFLLFVLLLWTPPTLPIPLPAAQHKDCHSALTCQIAAATGCCH